MAAIGEPYARQNQEPSHSEHLPPVGSSLDPLDALAVCLRMGTQQPIIVTLGIASQRIS